MNKYSSNISVFLNLIGIRYWTASILPALVGTTLPFWLNPPGFKFKLITAILFLIATLFGHAGFILLHVGFTRKSNSNWTKKQIFILGIFSLIVSILIGLHLNSSLQLHNNVPRYIFIVYGISIIFIGMLYVSPPFSFYRRVFGEVIICVGLGMLPVLGAYLIQVGDLTRTVYLASLPIVISTGLWLWTIELINKPEDERLGYNTLVMYFPFKFSSRFITLFLILLIYVSLLLAVFDRSSLNPFSLIALFSGFCAVTIIKVIWKDYENLKSLQNARKYSIFIHFSICIVIITASLSSIFFKI